MSNGWAAPRPPGGGRWHRLTDLMQGLWTLLVTLVAVSLGLRVAGVTVDDKWNLVLAVVVATVLLDLVLASPLRWLAARGSVILALLLGFGAQVVVLATAIGLTTYSDIGVSETIIMLVVASTILAIGRWISGATDSAYVVGAATARTSRRLSRHAATDRGLLVIQLDGVGLPVLRRAIAGGQAPNIARWLGSSHSLTGWWATIPCTTPATMAGVLQHSDDVVPAFRWWDRREGRLIAASNPADSHLVESRFTPGNGLLQGGAAISTTYTGEAERGYLVISNATRITQMGSGAGYLPFFIRPFLLPGALVMTIGEVLKELHQGRRQRIRGVEPRIPRKGAYVFLRGLTNVLLRKLNLSLIAEEMSTGAPIIFVDFVDYDEIAHHAGPERPESMRSIEGLDGVLAALEDVARTVSTHYDLVIFSDHGQSLGVPFADLVGRSFADHVADLMRSDDADASVLTNAEGGEDWGPINALLTSVLGASARREERVVINSEPVDRDEVDMLPEVVVTGGGNLGMIWFPRADSRPSLADIDAAWPRLVPGLLASDGIGLVMSTDDGGRPLVIGPTGARGLGPDPHQTGDDPLAGYPSRAAADLARLHAIRDTGDLVVISTVDELGQIHAFEGQVGSHGGIGGPQNEAILIHPRDWDIDPELAEVVPELGSAPVLVGAWNIHRQLLTWKERRDD